jgi:peptidoglycan/LPS O-acetylase OafA/YrhL
LLLAGIGLAMAIPGQDSQFIRGAFAVILVALCIFSRDVPMTNPLYRAAVRLGDWSYSLYLAHGGVLLLVGIAWRKVFGADFLWGYTMIVIFGSIIAAAVSYYWVERPMTRVARKLTRLGPNDLSGRTRQRVQ